MVSGFGYMIIVYITNTKTVMLIRTTPVVDYFSHTWAGWWCPNGPRLMKNEKRSIWAIVWPIHLLWSKRSKFQKIKTNFAIYGELISNLNLCVFFNFQLLLDYHANHFDFAANCAAMVSLGRKFVKRLPHLLRVQIFVHIARHILD